MKNILWILRSFGFRHTIVYLFDAISLCVKGLFKKPAPVKEYKVQPPKVQAVPMIPIEECDIPIYEQPMEFLDKEVLNEQVLKIMDRISKIMKENSNEV